MHISTIANNDGSFEIFFVDLNYWEEFDLIVDILEKENQCRIENRQTGPYSKFCHIKKGTVCFDLMHDDMWGNYIIVEKKENLEQLEKMAKDVINIIEDRLKEKRRKKTT